MINAARYQQLTFEDKGRGETVDCWGLVQRVYRDEFGIELPSYTEGYETTTDREEISAMIRREGAASWAAVAMPEARAGDVLLLRIEGMPAHVGVVLDAPRFLHAIKGAGVVVDRWDALLWKRRVLGCYRLAGAHV